MSDENRTEHARPGRFRTIAVAITLFFGFVALILGLSIQQLAALPHATATLHDPAALGMSITRLVWFQGTALLTGALLLAAMLFHVFRNLGQEEKAVNVAHRETQHILGTVNEGLFLLDRELVIGAEYSSVLPKILHRENLAGLKLGDLLRDMVPGKTLATALDFVELLWSDRVEEELIEDINPLNEVEVHFQNGTGSFETHWLKFSFKRVNAGTESAHIMVSVTDITEAMNLRLELQHAQAASEAQMDLLMSILHVPADQLHAFLTESEASLKSANAILMEPASSDAQFRDKIGQLFRAVHSVKSDAAGLGLSSIEAKAHSFEDELQQLRDRTEITGRDLLDLPIKLDDLLSHFANIHALVGRLTALRSAFELPAATPGAQRAVRPAPAAPMLSDVETTQQLPAPDPIELQVTTLSERISSELGKKVRIRTGGLADLPDEYRSAVKDIVLQLVRNSLVHGIEMPEQRQEAGKPICGQVTVGVVTDARTKTCTVTVEDDGRGLSASHIRAAAIRKGLLTMEQATRMKGLDLLSLIFRPGFSTARDVSEHAGRGVGMDVVKTTVDRLGGRISIGGKTGSSARFRILLPLPAASAAAA